MSLLGESAVDITPSTQGTPIPEWGYVPPAHAPAQLADIADAGERGHRARSTALRQRHPRRRGTVGKLMTDEQLYTELKQFVATAGQMTREHPAGPRHARQAAQRPEGGEALEASLKNLEAMTAPHQRRRGQPRQAAERRRVLAVADRRDDEPQGR